MDPHNIGRPRTPSHQPQVSPANGDMGGRPVTVGCGPSNGRKGNIFTQVASKISQFVKAIFSRPQENRQPVESTRFTAQTATRGTSENRQKKPQNEDYLQGIKTSFVKKFPVKSQPTQTVPKKVDHKEGDIVVVSRSIHEHQIYGINNFIYGVVISPDSKLNGQNAAEVQYFNEDGESKIASFDNNYIYPLSNDQKKEYDDYRDRSIQSVTDSPRQNAGTLKAKGLADRKEGRAAAKEQISENTNRNTDARHARETLRTQVKEQGLADRKERRAAAKEQKLIEKAKADAENKAKAKLIKDLTKDVKDLQNLFNNTPTAEAMRQEGKAVTADHDTNRGHLLNRLNAAKEALKKAKKL